MTPKPRSLHFATTSTEDVPITSVRMYIESIVDALLVCCSYHTPNAALCYTLSPPCPPIVHTWQEIAPAMLVIAHELSNPPYAPNQP